MHEAKT